jgi:CHAT domain-containing protein
MYAGAARVVVSLWSMNDRVAAELILLFASLVFGRVATM